MAKQAAQGNGKTVPADCVAVLLMALGSTSISIAQYNMMSALDGQRTASSFEHQFRSITQKAKELKARVDSGEKFEPVQPSKKRGAAAADINTPPVTPKKPKAAGRSKKPAKKKDPEADTNDDDDSEDFTNSGIGRIKEEIDFDEYGPVI